MGRRSEYRQAFPVHIRFFKGDEVIKHMVEFPVSDKIESRTFDIEGFTGSGKIDFIFLPGSDFDFVDFQFSKKE